MSETQSHKKFGNEVTSFEFEQSTDFFSPVLQPLAVLTLCCMLATNDQKTEGKLELCANSVDLKLKSNLDLPAWGS